MERPRGVVESRTTVGGSRFLARLAPAADRAAAFSYATSLEFDETDATHHCWAYRTWSADGIDAAGFDAGEPSGTAGRPILGALERADLVQAVCVVTRWFGGTKLGTGGLARAYAAGARALVEAARIARALEPVEPRARFEVRFDYPLTGDVRRVLAKARAREEDAAFGERVSLVVSVAVDRACALAYGLTEATAGRAEVMRAGSRLGRA